MFTLLVLYVDDIERSREFYSLLGITFVREQHGDGPVHYAAELRGGMVLKLYPAGVHPVTRTRLGVEVADQASAVETVRQARFTVKRQSLVIDPDGNRVELRERATRTSKVDDGARRKFGQFPDLDVPADFDAALSLAVDTAGDLTPELVAKVIAGDGRGDIVERGEGHGRRFEVGEVVVWGVEAGERLAVPPRLISLGELLVNVDAVVEMVVTGAVVVYLHYGGMTAAVALGPRNRQWE